MVIGPRCAPIYGAGMVIGPRCAPIYGVVGWVSMAMGWHCHKVGVPIYGVVGWVSLSMGWHCYGVAPMGPGAP